MSKDKFEKTVKKHAAEIFGQHAELPAGHRERFEQRLGTHGERTREAGCQPALMPMSDARSWERTREAGCKARRGRVAAIRKWLIATAAVAAALAAAILFRPNPPAEQDSGLTEVRSYYGLQLEEQADATRQLAFHMDSLHREALLAGIERIEREPVPDMQIPDDEYIVLIVNLYESRMETLRNIRDIIEKSFKNEIL
ncbi:MAG: hypothetical protein LBJ47_04425 [Tannerella sp.]|jgi:hypothetical protein|nr:hypothetical protein [Tannerella sp.]